MNKKLKKFQNAFAQHPFLFFILNFFNQSIIFWKSETIPLLNFSHIVFEKSKSKPSPEFTWCSNVWELCVSESSAQAENNNNNELFTRHCHPHVFQLPDQVKHFWISSDQFQVKWKKKMETIDSLHECLEQHPLRAFWIIPDFKTLLLAHAQKTAYRHPKGFRFSWKRWWEEGGRWEGGMCVCACVWTHVCSSIMGLSAACSVM